jgi:hypothetical protein
MSTAWDTTTWTGSREQWFRLSHELVSSSFERAANGQIHLDDEPGNHGRSADGMEGFSRVFLMAAFHIRGGEGDVPEAWRTKISESLRIGSQTTWPDPVNFGHAIVEAASISLALRMTIPWIWDNLPNSTREPLTAWLRAASEARTYENNWVLFTPTITGFLHQVNSNTASAVENAQSQLDAIETWYSGSGWYSDGAGRTFDYYNAWAFHFYPVMNAYLAEDQAELARLIPRLQAFIEQLSNLIAPNGAPIYFGRSLTYRFALTAPFSLHALIVQSAESGRYASSIVNRIMQYFLSRGAVEQDGILWRGWHGADPSTAQGYSGPMASYWASKAFVALLLPETDAFWEQADSAAVPQFRAVRPLPVPNFLTWSDDPGIARLSNHGSFNLNAIKQGLKADDDQYSRLGYSSITSPHTIGGVRDMAFSIGDLKRSSARAQIIPRGVGENWASSSSVHQIDRGTLLRKVPRRLAARAPLLRSIRQLRGLMVHNLTIIVDGWQVECCYLHGRVPNRSTLFFGSWAIPNGVEGPPSDGLTGNIISATAVCETTALAGFLEIRSMTDRHLGPFGSCASLTMLSSPAEAGRMYAVATRLAATLTPDGRSAPIDAPRLEQTADYKYKLSGAEGRAFIISATEEGLTVGPE